MAKERHPTSWYNLP